MINVCNHQEDFTMKSKSWNCFAKYHGKNAPNGVGANAKRIARTASLQGNCILNARQMYDHLSQKESEVR